MWIILIISVVALKYAAAEPLGTCKELLIETQNLGDSEQCDLYYGCTPSGAVVKKLCDDGYVFHLHAARCVINVNVDCGNRTKLQQPVAPTKECPRLNGFFPHPDASVCNKFYQCVKGKGDLKTCPATLVFDLQFGICLYPDQVNRSGCTANDLIQAKCPIYDGKTPLRFGDHERFAAPGGDCRNFIICLEDGGIRKGSCPFGKVYNDVTSSCDHAKNVPRCANYYPTTTTPKPTTESNQRKRPSRPATQSFRERYKQRLQQRKQQQQQRKQQEEQQPKQPQETREPQNTRRRPFRKQQPEGGSNRGPGGFQGFRRGPQFRPNVQEEVEPTIDNNVPQVSRRPQFRRRPQAPQAEEKPEEVATEEPTVSTRPRTSLFRKRTGIRDRPFRRPGGFNRRRPVISSRTKPSPTPTEPTTARPAQPIRSRATRKPAIGRDQTKRAKERLRSLFSRQRQRRPIRLKSTTPQVNIEDDTEPGVTTEQSLPQ